MDFYSTLLVHGLRLKESPLPDGKFHRVATDSKPKRKNGWYKLAYDGKTGWFGDYTNGLSVEWKPDAAELAIIPRRDDQELKKRQAEDRIIAGRAIAAAKKCWQNLSPMHVLHPYLQIKGLSPQGCDAIRIDEGGKWFKAWYKHKGVELHTHGDLLIIPLYRNDEILSLQAIDGQGKKLFWKDAPTKGAILHLKRTNATVTILCEGYATGLALFQSIPTASVIVCFNADNLVHIAEGIKLTGMAVVAADNDHETEKKRGFNPGIEKGQKAAEAIGCSSIYPEGISGSDWCDALAEWKNPARVRMAVLRGVRPVRRANIKAGAQTPARSE